MAATRRCRLSRDSEGKAGETEAFALPKSFQQRSKGFNPFGDLVGLSFSRCDKGYSECTLMVKDELLNPHRVVHGGVMYTMADTGMGAALYPSMDEDELCATIEIEIVYFTPVVSGSLVCEAQLIHHSGRIAVMESEISCDGRRVAKAMGTYSIFNVKRNSGT